MMKIFDSACPFCKTKIEDLAILKEHYSKRHSFPLTLINRCDRCFRIFDTVKLLNTHRKNHHKKKEPYFDCEFCGQLFSKDYQKNAHILGNHVRATSLFP